MDKSGAQKVVAIIIVLALCTVGVLLLVGSMNPDWFGNASGSSQTNTQVGVDQDAQPLLQATQGYTWTLTKTASPDFLLLAPGENADITYTITAERTAVQDNSVMAVKGSVHVMNVGSAPTKNLMITDVIQANGGSGFVDIASVAVDTSKKPVLAAGEEYWYPFTVYFKNVDGAVYQNYERVSISNLVDRTGQSLAAEAVMNVKAAATPLQVAGEDANVTVTDAWTAPNGWVTSPSTVGPWYFSDSGSVQYTVKVSNVFASFYTESYLTNTATLTGNDSGATVMADKTVTLSTNFHPGIKIVKSAPECVKMGDPITYTFTVYNIGDALINNVTVLDPMFPDSLNHYIGDMAAGSSVSFNTIYATNADTPVKLVNTATVHGFFKCLPISNSSTVTVNVVNPSISIVKTGPECVIGGSQIEWSFNITNTGDVKLINVVFTDAELGITENIIDLAPGQYVVFTKTSTAPMSGSVENLAVVNANTSCGIAVNAEDGATVNVVNPSMSFEKSGPTCIRLGDDIVWTFSIKNTGDVTLTNLTMVDPPAGVSVPLASLAPGEYWNFTYTTTPTETGSAYNYAYVTADAACGYHLNMTDDHSVMVINPSIDLIKGGPNTEVGAGSEIVWTFSIENTGDSNLINVIFSDPLLGQTMTYTDNGGVFVPGAMWQFTLSSMAPTTAPATVTNIAYVNATSECGSVTDVSDSSAWVVNIILNSPGIEIFKTGPECVQLGTQFTWSFAVHNIGNINLTAVKFDDPSLGISDMALPDLLVGQWYNFTKNQNAVSTGNFENVATVTGNSDFGEVTASDSASYSVINPMISIVKSAPDSVEPNATIEWTFVITNTGDVPLTNVVFSDPSLGETMTYTDNGGVLEVGASWEFSLFSTAPASGDVDNEASVAAQSPCGIQVSDSDSATVQVNSPCDCDCLLVTKTGTSEAKPGDYVVWKYTVFNCVYPNPYPCVTNLWIHDVVTLENGSEVSIVDAYSGDIIPNSGGVMVPWTLSPGEWFNFTVEFQIPTYWTHCEFGDWLNNTIKVQGCCAGGYARGQASWSTHITDCCSIKIEKFSNVDEAAPGDVIQYTLVITNTGENRLCALKVWECLEADQIDLKCDLAPCESITYTFNYTVPSDWNWCDNGEWLWNKAGACAYCSECDKWVKDMDCNLVHINCPPQIEITKTANVTEAWANPIYGNNMINWTITVRNVGPYPITCVNVVDEVLGLNEWIPCLMPCCKNQPSIVVPGGDGNGGCDGCGCDGNCVNTVVYYIEAPVPSDWSFCDNGDYLNNEASASGWACGHAVSDSDSASVLINDPYHLEIVKIAPEIAYQGQEITYSIMVRNAGSKVLSYIDVYDDVNVDGIVDWSTTIECLAPCTSEWFNFTYVVPQECYSVDYKLDNYVWATAWVRDVKVMASDSASTTIMSPCSLDIDIEAQAGAVPGETVTFNVTVTNDGNNTVVQMDVYGMIDSTDCSIAQLYDLGCIAALRPGESQVFTFTYTIPDCDQCCNVGYWLKYSASVKGECGCCDKDVVVMDDASGYLWVRACCAIDVDITGPSSAVPGETIDFNITVTNLGVNPLCDVSVWIDDLDWCVKIDGLMPGQTMSWTVSYTVPEDWYYCDDGDQLTMTAEAKGLCCECQNCGKEVRWATDSDVTSVYIDDPISLVVEKNWMISTAPDGEQTVIKCMDDFRPKPGDTVDYQIIVMNKGYKPLSCIQVTDSLIGYVGCIPCLLPCEQMVFNVSYEIPCNWTYCSDGEYLVNTATAQGWACDVAVSASDTETVTVNVDHIVEVFKTGPEEASPGESITYQISVHNGGKQPLTCLKVADCITNEWWSNQPMRDFEEMIDFREIGCLYPCEWYNFTVNYTVPETWTCMNGQWLFNKVMVQGMACWPCEMVHDCDLVWTKIVDVQPTIEVEKSVYASMYTKSTDGMEPICWAVPGQQVWYKFEITNPNCKALGCILVVDDELGYSNIIPCLQPFETVELWVPFTIPADWSYCANGDSIYNTVEVSAWACTKRISDTANNTLMIWDPMDLRISKVSDHPDGANPGDTITYTITVWNAGSRMLSSIMVVDKDLRFCEAIEYLMPCESVNYTLTYTVPEDWTYCCNGEYLNNSAYAWGLGCPVMMLGWDYAEASTSIMINCNDSIRVWKYLVFDDSGIADRPQRPEINPGDVLTWHVVVKNTGKTALSCINVTDVITRCDGTQWELFNHTAFCCLRSCEEESFDVTFTVPDDCCGDFQLTNVVTATAWAEDRQVSWSDTDVVHVEGLCDITVHKVAVNAVGTALATDRNGRVEVFADQPIYWKIWVENTGAKDLNCIVLTDDLFPGQSWNIGTLLKGQSSNPMILVDRNETMECNGTARWVENTASVTGKCCSPVETECGCIVSDTDSARVWLKPIYALDVKVRVDFDGKCCPGPGDTIVYNVWVTNTGEYNIVSGIDLWDDVLGNYTEITQYGEVFAAGQTWHNSYEYVIPDNWTFCDDGKYLIDTWYVEGCAKCGRVDVKITDQDSAKIEVCGPNLVMEKLAYVDGEIASDVYPGDVVTYEITVKNVGEHSVSCITIFDMIMIGWMPINFTSDQIPVLDPCTSYVWSFEFTVPEWYCVYGDYLNDSAMAWGIVNNVECCQSHRQMDGGYNPYMDLAWDSNALFVHNEFHLEIMKMDDAGCFAKPGDTYAYYIIVMNAGTKSITNIHVDDDMLGLHEYIDCLYPCDWKMYEVNHTVPSDWSYCDDGPVIVNTVTAKGWQCGHSQTVSDTDTVYVIDKCDVRIYIDAPATAKHGETITITVTVKNEGSSTATGLWVNDPVLGLNEMVWCLEPCESVTFTETVTVPPCDGFTHYVTGSVSVMGCCCDCCWMPHDNPGIESVMQKCCKVYEQADWSVMIVCGCCGSAPVPL